MQHSRIQHTKLNHNINFVFWLKSSAVSVEASFEMSNDSIEDSGIF